MATMPNTTSPIVPKAEPITQIDSSSAFTSVNNGRSYPPSSSPSPSPEPPTTPAKKTLKSKKTATPKTPKGPKTPKTKTPAKRVADGAATTGSAKKVKGTPVDRKAIPTSKEELSAEDKMMLAWKDEGKSWSTINAEWEHLTGKKPGGSTLPNRYSRVKAAVSCVDAADVEQMKASVKEVEAAMVAEYKEAMTKKWARVARHMKENGCEMDYVGATVEKHYKKLQAATETVSPSANSSVESGEEPEAGGDDEKEETGVMVRSKPSSTYS